MCKETIRLVEVLYDGDWLSDEEIYGMATGGAGGEQQPDGVCGEAEADAAGADAEEGPECVDRAEPAADRGRGDGGGALAG